MRSAIRGIDHVLIAVRDLAEARARWLRLGFTVGPRGRHVGEETANHCIMFAEDYVELLGAADASRGAQRLAGFLARREGAMAAALAPEGTIETVRAALLARGLHPDEARPRARAIETAEGPVVPRFSVAALPPEETPGLDCFVCGHLTPDLMRRPDWLRHPNGALGLRGIHVVVATTAELLPAYDRLFGLPQVTTTDAVAAVQVGRHRILFATPDDFLTMHPGLALDPDFPLPGIVALEFAVAGLPQTGEFFAGEGVGVSELPDGSLAVPARAATGAILIFSQL